jgi:hypothetical protein
MLLVLAFLVPATVIAAAGRTGLREKSGPPDTRAK